MYTSSCFLHQFFNSTILKFYSTPLYAIGTSLEHNWQKTTLPTLLYAALNKMLYLLIFLLLIYFFLLILLILSLFLLKYSRACIFCCWKCFIHFSIRLLRSCACVCVISEYAENVIDSIIIMMLTMIDGFKVAAYDCFCLICF